MKPVILFSDDDGFVKIKQEPLIKLIDDAYNAGYEDGKKSSITITPTWTSPWTEPPVTYDKWEVTCDKTKRNSVSSDPAWWTSPSSICGSNQDSVNLGRPEG